MRVESDAKFEEKLALGFKNDMMNLVNFNASSGKSENLHFDNDSFFFTPDGGIIPTKSLRKCHNNIRNANGRAN